VREGPPRVLAVVDRPHWAIDSKARNLQRVLAGRFEIRARFQHEVTEADLEAADIVLVFYWLELLKMPVSEAELLRHSRRLIMGICSHFELQDERRDQGLDILRRLPCAIFANNAALVREFAPLVEVPVHYTPNGVDTAFFRPSPEARPRRAGQLRVGWAGSLTNQGPLQRRFREVIEPAVAAVPGATRLAAIREERWRNREEMLEFYRGLDVYVCASRSEGTPNSCLEAAACGVPLVTTPVGNMPELVRDGESGLFFDGTVEDLAAKLTVLRDSPELAAGLAGRMLETVRGWDWSRQAQNYARLFEAVLRTSSASLA
jgi:hypothetical protein